MFSGVNNCGAATLSNNGFNVAYGAMTSGTTSSVQCTGGAQSTVSVTCYNGIVAVTSGMCEVSVFYDFIHRV